MAKKTPLLLMILLTCFTLYAGVKFFTSQTKTASNPAASATWRVAHPSLLTSEPVEYHNKSTINLMDSMVNRAGPLPKYWQQMADITTQRVAQEHKVCKSLHLSPEETLKRVRAVSDGGQQEVERVEALHFTVPFNVRFAPVYKNPTK